MKECGDTGRMADLWAQLRFAIVGPLLASPPSLGELNKDLAELSKKFWNHPRTGLPVRFGASSIERWFYVARKHPDNPVAALRRRVRADAGLFPCFGVLLRNALWAQYKAHPNWSCQLHVDNLSALCEKNPEIAPAPKYQTIRRYMRAQGMTKRPLPRDTAGGRMAMERLEQREVRSYECSHVLGLWHLDFHHGSLKILTESGEWVVPMVLAILDDRSRMICHIQWYLDETAQSLVHGLSQAMQKRGKPRSLLTDNGSAMTAAETISGLKHLGIAHETTLPYSPFQNGKQEVFWGSLEGRLMRMLDGERELSLSFLNEATQAWVEMEYNRRLHTEIGQSPMDRFLQGPSSGRESPSSERLRQAFRLEERRTLRRSDCTIVLAGRRFEVPSAYRHIAKIHVRYARWDLGYVHMADRQTGQVLCRLYPQDKDANSGKERRKLSQIAGADPLVFPAEVSAQEGRPPLLAKLLADYAASGFPPAYLPHMPTNQEASGSTSKKSPALVSPCTKSTILEDKS